MDVKWYLTVALISLTANEIEHLFKKPPDCVCFSMNCLRVSFAHSSLELLVIFKSQLLIFLINCIINFKLFTSQGH